MKKITKISFPDLILTESDNYLIINKPPGISSLDDRRSERNVLEMARHKFPEARLCHRLDKETSGILVISKNDKFYKYFSKLLETRSVTKLYHAVVEGIHDLDEVEMGKPIYTSSSRSRIDYQQGKPSLTLVSTMEVYKKHTLVACMPFTGRMHQIRVHLSDWGAPIVADSKYGGPSIYLSEIKRKYKMGKDQEERPLISRLALHSAGISFEGLNGKIVKIKAPYPKDFNVLIKQLEKNKS